MAGVWAAAVCLCEGRTDIHTTPGAVWVGLKRWRTLVACSRSLCCILVERSVAPTC
ncbi:mCG58495 [Mus musculus]|nr:mCG58495 [Mus musculus]